MGVVVFSQCAVLESAYVATVFGDFDMSDFWEKSAHAAKEYVGRPLDALTVRAVEQELGYKLPSMYVEFMKFQNGGFPRRANHRTKEPTSWAHDHIAVHGFFSVGRDTDNSLCGYCKSQFWVDEWGYPPIGVYFADCPSAGHDMICLDYSKCGRSGEPRVVHVDQDLGYKITVLADNFELFVRGLEDDSAFATGA